MNLPTLFEELNSSGTVVAGSKRISITYDGSGAKLKKTTSGGTASENYTQYYLGGIEYRDGLPEAIYHGEGRVNNTSSTTTPAWRYEYAIRDHLGNTRLMFADLDGNGVVGSAEVLQENHYYPFGMNMEGAWLNNVTTKDSRFQYNGKELNEDFGLNWNDYGARWYDASVGRWNAVDPSTERYLDMSGFNYVLNNPVGSIDPNGKDVFIIIWSGDDSFRAAAETRRKEIERRGEFNSKSDHVYIIHASDMGKLKDQVASVIADAKANDFGKTVEASFYTHAGEGDGPVGEVPTSRYAVDEKQLSLAGWKEINFNFDPQRSIAGFYGCITTNFACKFMMLTNVRYTVGFGAKAGDSTDPNEFRAWRSFTTHKNRAIYIMDNYGVDLYSRYPGQKFPDPDDDPRAFMELQSRSKMLDNYSTNLGLSKSGKLRGHKYNKSIFERE